MRVIILRPHPLFFGLKIIKSTFDCFCSEPVTFSLPSGSLTCSWSDVKKMACGLWCVLMSVLDFKTAGEKNLKNFMKGQQSTKNVIDITIITLNKTLSLENYSPSLMFYSKSFLVKSRGSVLHMQEKNYC